MSNITSIKMTILEGNCFDDAHAKAFASWAEAELQRRYPAADVRVDLVVNTSGASPRASVDAGDDYAAEENVQDECDRLGEDWARAGWPGVEVAE